MKKILFILFISAFSLSACGGGTSNEIFQISDPAKQLEAAAGNEFKIVIASNPSTGYHWELVDELDGNIVEFVSREYRGSGEEAMPGSGGVDVWTFKALAAGEIHITLGYYPPSNDPVEAQQTVLFTVIVK
ncbi:MAG: protease inhibitor I42 family protein [Anaerolineales bacterium]|nr:MAG: protease inhibitor I42 family protein [Anaerolineales bacterium]